MLWNLPAEQFFEGPYMKGFEVAAAFCVDEGFDMLLSFYDDLFAGSKNWEIVDLRYFV